MKEWFIRYWLESIFGVILAVLGAYFRKKFKEQESIKREQDAIKLGVQALLRDRIVQSYNYYMEKRHCPIYAMDNINALYCQYHALGGNGTITELVDKLKDLPTKNEFKEEN